MSREEKFRDSEPEVSPVQTKPVSESDTPQHSIGTLNRNEDEYETRDEAINPDLEYFSDSEWKYCSKIYGGDLKSERPSYNQRKIEWTEGSFIGSGSYGTVVMGLEKQTGNLMAVKKVHVEEIDGKNKDKVEALKHEISFYERLSNDNIVRYIGFEKGQDSFNIFLEYIEGTRSLNRRKSPVHDQQVRTPLRRSRPPVHQADPQRPPLSALQRSHPRRPQSCQCACRQKRYL